MVTIFGAEPLSLETEPQLPQAKTRIPPEKLVTYKAEDAQWAVAQLSSGKAGPCIRSGGPADQDKFGGAVAEQWKTVVGQRAQAPLSACAQASAAATTEATDSRSARSCSADRSRDSLTAFTDGLPNLTSKIAACPFLSSTSDSHTRRIYPEESILASVDKLSASAVKITCA